MRLQKSGFHGVYLADADIALDGPAPEKDTAVFISHAHADHTPRNRKSVVYASPATAALMRVRGHKGVIHEIPFGKTVTLPRAEVTLYPAGHILGSAMIFVECDAGTLLYTGDCRNPPSPVTEGFAIPDKPVDHLIVEATFGLPIYKWASHAELFKDIRRFVREALEKQATPVLLCYNLGKAQEVMHALAESDPPVIVQIHEAGVELSKVYEQYGINLGNWEPYNRETLNGKVLVTPSSTLDTQVLQNSHDRLIAYISGWAALEARSLQISADAFIPLSDHLDFFELMALCRRLQPGHVYLTHSPNPDVAIHYLEQYGISGSRLSRLIMQQIDSRLL